MIFKKKNSGLVFFLVMFCALILISACESFGQRQNTLERRCAGNSPVVPFAKVEVQRDGDINIIPCSGRTFQVAGVSVGSYITSLNGLTAATQLFAIGAADTAVFSSATATHTLNLPITAVSGTSRTNFFPYFNGGNTLAKSPFGWDGFIYSFNNTSVNSEYKMDFVPNLADGEFRVGDYTTTPTNYLTLSQTSNNFTVKTTGSIVLNSGIFRAGDTTAATNGTYLELLDASQTYRFRTNSFAGIFNLTDIANFQLYRTITPSGTTGSQIIDKTSGTVNIAASGSSVTVTNSTVTANSIISVVARTNDATCSVKNYVPGAGSFVINMTASCTAETSIGFIVTN